MNDIKDGGPAFPVFPPENHAVVNPGMSLRDYFAAHSPIDMGEARNSFYAVNGRNPTWTEAIDTLAYLRGLYADAMLKDRGQ